MHFNRSYVLLGRCSISKFSNTFMMEKPFKHLPYLVCMHTDLIMKKKPYRCSKLKHLANWDNLTDPSNIKISALSQHAGLIIQIISYIHIVGSIAVIYLCCLLSHFQLHSTPVVYEYDKLI